MAMRSSSGSTIDVVIPVRRDTARDLKRVAGNEAHEPDLGKKDIVARTGAILWVVLA